MQPRCLHCEREQYAMAVVGVSHGELGCTWCGRRTAAMSEDQLISILRTNISVSRTPYTCIECNTDTGKLDEMLAHLRERHPYDD